MTNSETSTYSYLGAVYTYDFVYDSAYESVYDLLPKGSTKLIWDQFFTKYVYIWLQFVYDKELDPYMACMKIVHGIVRGIVHGFVHV